MTKLDIINMALGHVGGETVQSSESPGVAKTCSENLPRLIDILLNAHYWSFAKEYTSLTSLTKIVEVEGENVIQELPFGNFMYTFNYPQDLVTIISIDGVLTGDFQFISGRRIAANVKTLNINYIKRIDDYSHFTSGFCEALSLLLAYHISTRVGSVDIHVKNDLMTKYSIYLNKAISEDSMFDFQSTKGEYELVDE